MCFAAFGSFCSLDHTHSCVRYSLVLKYNVFGEAGGKCLFSAPFIYATVTSQFWGVEAKLSASLPLSHLVTDLETPNQCINCEAFFLQTGSLISPVKNNFCWKICNFNFYRATVCYSAVFAVVMCLSVCLSVHLSVCQNPVSKRLDKSSWGLACRLPSTYPTLF